MRCHIIVETNLAHNPPRSYPVYTWCIHRPHSPQYIQLLHVLLLEYKYTNIRSIVVFLLCFLHVLSFCVPSFLFLKQVVVGTLPVLLWPRRVSCNDCQQCSRSSLCSLAHCSPMGPTLASAIDYRSDAILGLQCIVFIDFKLKLFI